MANVPLSKSSSACPVRPPSVKPPMVAEPDTSTGALSDFVMQARWLLVGGEPVDQFEPVPHAPPAGLTHESSHLAAAPKTGRAKRDCESTTWDRFIGVDVNLATALCVSTELAARAPVDSADSATAPASQTATRGRSRSHARQLVDTENV